MSLTATKYIDMFIDNIFRVLFAYIKSFYEICIEDVHTMI